MKINLQNSVEGVQIQVLPLIDVVFCILTFFLLAALQFTRQQAINIDLPKAKTGTSAQVNLEPNKRNILPVSIDAIGQTFVEKEPVNKEKLANKLKQYLEQNPQGVLVLNASRSATYNDVIETLDILREVGGGRVALGIIPGPAGATNNSPSNTPIPNNPTPNNLSPDSSNFNLPPLNNQAPVPPTAPSQPQKVPVNPKPGS
ncbi:ExbD/TolR family protein [Calothrix rhizosoleniae]|uniref:ExbD/TolR family protein n=1 Tax=Calothrix rhizosoleniae TaxID=888997 RepID=UPI000B4A22EE|nr:biopolymer transporter ExbD [Calothrix rhizosoleniae]